MSGGVRNLRAMFENKDESTPPPDRGRSPAGSVGGGSNGTSPRPLSKVRTSFVAVERNGQLGSQWGLRKESNTDPSLATRRASFSIDEETDPKAMAERKQSIASEISARNNSTSVVETIPESAIETPPVVSETRPSFMNGNTGREKASASEHKNPSIELDKKISVEGHTARVLPSDAKDGAVVVAASALNNVGVVGGSMNGNTVGEVQTLSPTKRTARIVPAGRSPKPMPISTAPSSNATKSPAKPAKSPAGPQTPTTPAKTSTTAGKSVKQVSSKPTTSGSTTQTKAVEKPVAKPTSKSTSATTPVPRPSTSSTVASTSEKKATHTVSSTGFHKPRPKSPTKPAKLPASMTAPTASSLSKVSASAIAPAGRQLLAPPTKTVSRSPSINSLGQKQDLRRRPSTVNNDRPALGRPSTTLLKKQPSRQSLPRQTAPADESFLARMMRPTTSSASKTTEKLTTPPRPKVATRPTTREGPSHHHKPHEGLRGSPSSKRLPTVSKEAKKEGLKTVMADAENELAAAAGSACSSEPAISEKENKRQSTGLKREESTDFKTEENLTESSGKETQAISSQPLTALEKSASSDTTVKIRTESGTQRPEVTTGLFDGELGIEHTALQEEALKSSEEHSKPKDNEEKSVASEEIEVPTVNGKDIVRSEDLEIAEDILEPCPQKTNANDNVANGDQEVD